MTTRVHIETDRLILKTVSPEDVDAVALNWQLDVAPISLSEAKNRVRWMQANHEKNQPGKIIHLCLAIIIKDSGELIGWSGLDHCDPAKPYPVLFYLLKSWFWGQGLATEAARAVLGYAFGELELERVDSGAAFENLASKRVMEKIGMRFIGLDEEGGYAFSLTKEEYRHVLDKTYRN